MAEEGKIIIVSAPSGTGKSTVIGQIIDDTQLNLDFSVSCTSRQPRKGETHGVNYYFITHEEFKRKVEADEFIEWEEVYAGTCYGTLASEVERVTKQGKNLILDIDVKGALNVKKRYGERALAVFIMPPSIDVLGDRLRARATDTEQVIQTRLNKAAEEISYAPQFDKVIINDKLDQAVADMRQTILNFIKPA